MFEIRVEAQDNNGVHPYLSSLPSEKTLKLVIFGNSRMATIEIVGEEEYLRGNQQELVQ